jgi:hypothetical protein
MLRRLYNFILGQIAALWLGWFKPFTPQESEDEH